MLHIFNRGSRCQWRRARGVSHARHGAVERRDFVLLPGRRQSITKIIDGLAADFEKENPGIKVKPIYSGDYHIDHEGADRGQG